MRFEVQGPFDATENDSIEMGDEIRRGDLVWFDRVEPTALVLRLVKASVEADCYRVLRSSDANVMKLNSEPKGAHQKIWRYFDIGWRSHTFRCSDCSWVGDASSMESELFDELIEFKCQTCEKIILIISYPTISETKEAAVAGNAEAIAELEKLNES